MLAAIFAIFCSSVLAAEAANGSAAPGIVMTLARWAPLIFEHFLFNLLVSVFAMLIGSAAGVALGLAQLSLIRPLRHGAWLATQFFRNAPWLVLLFYVMFLIPFSLTVMGQQIPIPGWFKAIIGLSLPVMANVSEIMRGGITSIPYGQWESAQSLALNRRQTLWMVVIPQAIRRMIPPWMNLYAILTMATSLISVVGVQEAVATTEQALVADGRTELFIPMYAMLLLMFFVYCYPIARWTARLERRFNVKA